MFKAGLVLRKGPTDNVFDAIRKGYPVKEIAQGKPVEIPATVGQQEASAVAQQKEEAKPDVVAPGPQQTCPPGYTYALGYCVRDVNYYGCIPGVEYWDGTKCSRNWPKCSEGINNDLNTGQCLEPKLDPAVQTIQDLWGPGSNAIKDAVLAEAAKQQQAAAQAIPDLWGPGSNATKDAVLAEAAKQQAAPIDQATQQAPQQILDLFKPGESATRDAMMAKLVQLKTITQLPTFDTTNIDTSNPITSGPPPLLDVVKNNPFQEIQMADGTKQVYDDARQELRIYDASGNLLSVNSYIALDPTSAFRDNSLGGAVEAAREPRVTTAAVPRIDRPDDGITRRRRR